ncbi:hypothetical protein ACWZEH_33580 [Streptomyces sp. QTS137]
MRVVFTKGPGTSYGIAVHRESGAEPTPRNGPGGHPYLPHDPVRFLVEAEGGVRLGVYGRSAAVGTVPQGFTHGLRGRSFD